MHGEWIEDKAMGTGRAVHIRAEALGASMCIYIHSASYT